MPKSNPVLCCSIARSIGGMGVRTHNAAFRHMNLNYTYVSFEPSGAKAAVDAMRALGIRGMGVTMPYKEEIMNYIDGMDDMSKEIGAVNTIVNDDGRLTGYNTDVYGFVTALEEMTSLHHKKVAVIGAGGGAKAVLYGLKQYTEDIVLYNRDPARGRSTAERFHIPYVGSPELLDANTEYDIQINCTSVGFKSEDTLMTRERIRPNRVVMDIIFTPIETTLLKEAQAAGCRTVSGVRMVMHQSYKQFEHYTGVPAPVEVYERVIMEICAKK